MPSPLFDALFLVALLVPIGMYLTGLMILVVSLAFKHFSVVRERRHSIAVLAH